MTQPHFLFEDDEGLSIQERFERFHARHPEVYEQLVSVCRRWLGRGGRSRWSIDAAYHVLRWERRMAGLPDDDEVYKLNDHYTSRYARLIMQLAPDLDGIFETRVLRSVAR